MRVTTAWAESEVDGEMPWLISAYDEYTEDSWGCTPDWFTEAIRKQADADGNGPRVRVLVINIPESAVEDLFATPEVKGTIESDA